MESATKRGRKEVILVYWLSGGKVQNLRKKDMTEEEEESSKQKRRCSGGKGA